MPKGDTEPARRRKAARTGALLALAEGRVQLSEYLLDPPEALEHVELWIILLRCQRLGRIGAAVICREAGVFSHERLGELTPQQRQMLVQALPPRLR